MQKVICLQIINLTEISFAYSVFRKKFGKAGVLMKRRAAKMLAVVLWVVLLVYGCAKESDVKETPAEGMNQTQKLGDQEKQPLPADVAVSVDGTVLKKAQLDQQVKDIMRTYRDQIPKDKVKEFQVNIKTQLVENFIMRTLLENEIARRRISVEEKEIQDVVDRMKSRMEPGQKIEDFLKANKVTMEDLRKNIAGDLKVKKIILMELGGNAKPSRREISKFYKENQERFTIPESVHLRHILVMVDEKDTDKIKAEKRQKIEKLRKQILEGADFAQVAKEHSDCPSRENGGDLGVVTRGQTVKPFEEAAFSQKIKEIGPVIATDYGYHIIQVLERNPEKKIALSEVRDKISDYLEQQKQHDAFATLINKLREKADIRIN